MSNLVKFLMRCTLKKKMRFASCKSTRNLLHPLEGCSKLSELANLIDSQITKGLCNQSNRNLRVAQIEFWERVITFFLLEWTFTCFAFKNIQYPTFYRGILMILFYQQQTCQKIIHQGPNTAHCAEISTSTMPWTFRRSLKIIEKNTFDFSRLKIH